MELLKSRGFGLIQRKERWTLTLPGRILSLLLPVLLLVWYGLKIEGFLAQHQPVQANVLVVEGHTPDFLLQITREEFQLKQYSKLVVVGGVMSKGAFLSSYKNYAELGVASLIAMGVKESDLAKVPAPRANKDRTYSGALALDKYMRANMPNIKTINIVSIGAHARRTRMLYEMALGDGIEVGIISVEDPDYDSESWWSTSAGFKTVIYETIAYIYTKLFFFPSEA